MNCADLREARSTEEAPSKALSVSTLRRVFAYPMYRKVLSYSRLVDHVMTSSANIGFLCSRYHLCLPSCKLLSLRDKCVPEYLDVFRVRQFCRRFTSEENLECAENRPFFVQNVRSSSLALRCKSTSAASHFIPAS